MSNLHLRLTALIGAALNLVCAPADAQVVPSGFTYTTLAPSLSNATCLAQTPDGRILIARQSGELRVWKDGTFLPTPMHTFAVNGSGEQGFIGLAVDPQFEANGYVYSYVITAGPGSRGKLMRITIPAGSDVSSGSETELFDLGAASGIHLGGAVHFGPDGKLYVALGDHASSANSQSLTSIFGKILRINADGSIPADNPFYSATTGDNRAIWARGLRNPFTFAFSPVGSRMFINDVGAGQWEEVNDGVAGANYGWPTTEGHFDPALHPLFTNPILAYNHTVPGSLGFTGFVVVGGAFYETPNKNFPATFNGDYFFGDYGRGWIRALDTATNITTEFATGMSGVVDFGIDQQGRLLLLRRGSLARVEYTNPIGACCTGFACTAMLEADCATAGGTFRGIAVPCLTAGEPAACCRADFDGNGAVQVPDIFAFLSAWFASDPRADIDGIPGIQVPDIFAFLSSWFSSCAG